MRRWRLLILFSILLSPALSAQAHSWDPWQWSAASKPQAPRPDSMNPLVQGIRFFQRYISVVDSPRCPMIPTCSAYALQALDKHGAALGTFITVDRLLHETNPLEQTVPVSGYARPRFADPLTNNDFWLTPPSQADDPEKCDQAKNSQYRQ